MFSDAYLTVLSNKNNPVANIFFRDLYPTSLDALEFTQAATDVEYVSVNATFSYSIYETNLPDFGFCVAHTNVVQNNQNTLDKLEQEWYIRCYGTHNILYKQIGEKTNVN